MDFYSIFDEQPGANEEKAQNNQASNETEQSVNSYADQHEPVQSAAKPMDGVPVRWDFKAILKQEETAGASVENSTEEVVSEISHVVENVIEEASPVLSESTGDSDFDREWAEMLAREEAEKQAQFVAENQMDSVEAKAGEVESAEQVVPVTRMKSVAEIMRGFGNPGMDENEEMSETTSGMEETPVVAEENEIVEFRNEASIVEAEVNNENAEVIAEMISETETAILNNEEWTASETEIEKWSVAEISAEENAEPEFNVAAAGNIETNMSESENTIEGEGFEPIELASEPELPVETTVPVFVNVEHAWMYAEESHQEPAEMLAEETTSFESALPGELPFFAAETQGGTTMQTDTHTHNNLKSEEAMKFELPEYSSIIKVIGVGGGGSNAVNHMYKLGIKGVDFLVCNTDKQALDLSPVPHKIVLGTTLTEGRGAGSIPEVGRNAAIENIEDLRAVLSNNTKMVFITAGMGGGTGTGAAPVIAGVARELGILTVGIVTVPFAHEGKKRRQYAEEGIEQLKQNVDTLLVIRNDKLREMYGNLKLSDAFAHADDVLTTAAKSIAEIISITQQINVDFADICTVMRNSGVAIMGSAVASGENRAVRAVEMSLNSPLLNDNNIIGARYVLLNIISGSDEITMDELGEITDFIQEAAGQTAEIIKGYGVDTSLGDSVSVTIIATGFQQTSPVNYEYTPKSQPEKVVRHLGEKHVVEAPKAETVAPAPEAQNNPLEPFLVSKPVEPVAESKPEWNVASVELEIVNTSQEITEVTSDAPVFNEVQNNEIVSEKEEVKAEEIIEPVLVVKKEEVTAKVDPIEAAKKAEQEEIQRRANERIQKLRDISLKLKSPQVLNEMENEPAYKRRNVNLENVPHSSESQVSRFTLTETEEKKIEIRPNNSFLHDNVD